MTGETGVPFIQAANHWTGREGEVPHYVILHGTAGFARAQDVATFFANPATQASAHYVVGMDGGIIQMVDEDDAAWSNGPISGPPGTSGDGLHHDPWWDSGINPNLLTIAIEHVKPHIDNSDVLTDAQKAASFQLVRHICQRWNIPMRYADANGGITGHYSMDPVNRSRCPGPYPWDALWTFLGGTPMGLPQGWSDDGTTLKCGPFVVIMGFRDYVLNAMNNGDWRNDDIPYEDEHAANPLEWSNNTLKPGTKQRFRYTTLEWNPDRGVFPAYNGPELIKLEQIIAQQVAQIQQLQQQHTLPANISQITQALNAIIAMASQLRNDGDTIAAAAHNALAALGK